MPSEVKRLKQLEEENPHIRRLVADVTLDGKMFQDVIRMSDHQLFDGMRLRI